LGNPFHLGSVMLLRWPQLYVWPRVSYNNVGDVSAYVCI